jgi:hypothetical protein
MNNPAQLKLKLYARCLEYADERIRTAKRAMDAAQESANEESKSSAGDKYETGRSMMQLERDRCAAMLAEALKLKNDLDQIDAGRPYAVVVPGSLVITNQGNYFLSISAGKVTVDGVDYFAVSGASPVGQQLRNRRANDEIVFASRKIRIQEVW